MTGSAALLASVPQAPSDGAGSGGALKLQAIVKAIDLSTSTAMFDLDGHLREANANFLDMFGYTLDEARGQHHRMFCTREQIESSDYAQFWAKLRRGEFDRGEYRRVRRDGGDVWLQATYNPVLDEAGRPIGIVKLATDITAQKARAAEAESQLTAIDRSQLVIEFTPTGEVVSANANFLAATGYALGEIVGRHHRMFCTPALAASGDYRDFWGKLASGAFHRGDYERIGRGGRRVRLQATYNPVFDASGRPLRVVKFATDITAQRAQAEETAARERALSLEIAERRARLEEMVNEVGAIVDTIDPTSFTISSR
ncbi:MAG: PAS domain S-box protein, partial [Sphingomonadales bacterium]